MRPCVSCNSQFESNVNVVYCDVCVTIAHEFWQRGVEVINAEMGDVVAEVVADGWLYIKGNNDQTLFNMYLHVLEVIEMANIPNTWEVEHNDVTYVLKLHPVDINKPTDHIVPKGKISRDYKVLTQPLFIKRKADEHAENVKTSSN